jgi:hypothetical protein
MQAEALETLVNNHYKGLITALASRIQDTVEANIRDWLSNELKNMLEHHDVVFKGAINTVSEQVIEDYLDRNDYLNEDNIDRHIENYIESSEVVTQDSLNDSINEWMSNNFEIKDYDIQDNITDAVRSINFTVEVN